jgi:hypothetical protein
MDSLGSRRSRHFLKLGSEEVHMISVHQVLPHSKITIDERHI